MKIVYCINTLCFGSIDAMIIKKANALAEFPDNNIYIIVSNYVNYAEGSSACNLSSKVRLINLQLDQQISGEWSNALVGLKFLVRKAYMYKHCLQKYLTEIDPDIVVSTGGIEKFMLPFIHGTWKLIREFHFSKKYRIFEANTLLNKLIAKLANWFEFGYVVKKYDHIVVLTHEDRNLHWKTTKNISVIPNAVELSPTPNVSSGFNKKIIAVGRLVRQKNFLSLIRAFRMVVFQHPDWVLEIYGNGPQKQMLQKAVDEMNLNDNVFLMGHAIQINEKMSEAYCFVLSSINEGFGLVLIEAMSNGLPVVAYDCPCGPKDIITDGIDGILVPTSNERILAEKICYLIEHPQKRIIMGEAAKEKATEYNIEKIIPLWMELFENLLFKQAT